MHICGLREIIIIIYKEMKLQQKLHRTSKIVGLRMVVVDFSRQNRSRKQVPLSCESEHGSGKDMNKCVVLILIAAKLGTKM